MQVSIDMFASDKNGDMSWMVWSYGDSWTWDKKLQQYHEAIMASVDHILLSYNMAEGGFIDHWADIASQHNNPQSTFARSLTVAQKTVFSRTPKETHWDNTTFASRELSEEVRHLKSSAGKNIIAFGGVGFARSLIAQNLIDELHLIVNPTVLGSGAAIFSELTHRLPLTLIGVSTYEDGMVVAQYKK